MGIIRVRVTPTDSTCLALPWATPQGSTQQSFVRVNGLSVHWVPGSLDTKHRAEDKYTSVHSHREAKKKVVKYRACWVGMAAFHMGAKEEGTAHANVLGLRDAFGVFEAGWSRGCCEAGPAGVSQGHFGG